VPAKAGTGAASTAWEIATEHAINRAEANFRIIMAYPLIAYLFQDKVQSNQRLGGWN